MTKSPRKNVPDVGIELGAACMPSELASNRATAPSPSGVTKRSKKSKNSNKKQAFDISKLSVGDLSELRSLLGILENVATPVLGDLDQNEDLTVS